jgi:hypothetical protein
LEGGKADSKQFSKMFRDLGKGYRAKPKGRVRPPKGGKAKASLGGMGGMDDMMMAMMMGEMMSDVMDDGRGKKKKGGSNNFMNMMMDDDSDEDLPDEYDSDEVEQIGKHMGLSKKELEMLKKDLKYKYAKKD